MRRDAATAVCRAGAKGTLIMARVLIIAYTTYAHDGRVKREAEALSAGICCWRIVATAMRREWPQSARRKETC